MSRVSVVVSFNRAVDKPGACYIFLHTMATLLHGAGVDVRALQAMLVNGNIDTTQIYTRVGSQKRA